MLAFLPDSDETVVMVAVEGGVGRDDIAHVVERLAERPEGYGLLIDATGLTNWRLRAAWWELLGGLLVEGHPSPNRLALVLPLGATGAVETVLGRLPHAPVDCRLFAQDQRAAAAEWLRPGVSA